MLYAIGDLHLSLASGKPMDVFGGNWENHHERIIANWKSTVCGDDYVVINGDVSWAINDSELKPDMDLINSMPGKKIISLGNHDYWFDSANKFYAKYPDISLLIKGNFLKYKNTHICGTKGWVCPDAPDFKQSDAKLYKRETLRLENSLKAAMKDGAENILCVLHFPPFADPCSGSEFLRLIEEYPVSKVIYGHLHSAAAKFAFMGRHNGIDYILTSSDYAGFTPVAILE